MPRTLIPRHNGKRMWPYRLTKQADRNRLLVCWRRGGVVMSWPLFHRFPWSPPRPWDADRPRG